MSGIMYEIWRPVASHPGTYEVSNLGRVRSVARVIPGTGPTGKPCQRHLAARILRTCIGGRAKNYLRVKLQTGKPRHAYVHHLVAEAFHGPRPFPRAMARHLNDVGTDNRAENLAWGTRADNDDDAAKAARHAENMEARHADPLGV